MQTFTVLAAFSEHTNRELCCRGVPMGSKKQHGARDYAYPLSVSCCRRTWFFSLGVRFFRVSCQIPNPCWFFNRTLSLSLLVYLKRRRELSTMPMHSLCILLDICMCKCYIFVDWFLNGWGQASDAYIIIEVFSENVSAVISQP